MSREQFLKEVFKQFKSEDWDERFRGELRILSDNIEKLSTMLYKYSKNELEFKPKCSLELLLMQYNAMTTYQQILLLRANIEGIKL